LLWRTAACLWPQGVGAHKKSWPPSRLAVPGRRPKPAIEFLWPDLGYLDRHGGTRGIAHRGPGVQAGGRPPATSLLPYCGPVRRRDVRTSFRDNAHCVSPNAGPSPDRRDGRPADLEERRPAGQSKWCHSPPREFGHTQRLTSIPEYILNGYNFTLSTGSCNCAAVEDCDGADQPPPASATSRVQDGKDAQPRAEPEPSQSRAKMIAKPSDRGYGLRTIVARVECCRRPQ